MFEFTVYGEPKGKARPKLGNNGRIYSPESTKKAESEVEATFIAAGGTQFKGYVKVEIYAYFKIPNRTSLAKREEMLLGLVKPDKPCDLDNICKLILDGLGKNRLAFHNDAAVTTLIAQKFYGEVPRVMVRISSDE